MGSKVPFVLVLLLPALVCTYEHFREKIPNGDRVPHPYLINYVWKGVGHNNGDGGGSRNPFGEDFERNSYVWDKCICEADSDGDGKTNGEELGDPQCVWKLGSQPDSNTGLSHPGICEPLDSEKCQGKNDMIDFDNSEPFSCNATAEEGVMTIDIKYERTVVPAQETTYFCDFIPLDLPANKSYHVIAYEPLLDNVEFMHHTLVYGCRDDTIGKIEESRQKKNITGPQECENMECSELILLWAVGSKGMCYPEAYGAMIGEGGFKAVYMENHYNNPLKKAGMTDASGMKLYFTENLRPNTMSWLFWGPMSLALPVGARKYVQGGSCPSSCTSGEDFPETMTIVEIGPHMHYLGRALRATHVRPGVGGFEKVILEEDNYSYDNPTLFRQNPPLEFRRGDEIRVNCTFNTMSATKPIFWGDGTYDEMCFLLMAVYPYTSAVPTFCMTNNGVGHCNKLVGDWGNCSMEEYGGKVFNYYMDLVEKCDPTGLKCLPGCQKVIDGIYAKDPCLGNKELRPVVTQWSISGDDKSYVNMLVSCTKVPVHDDNKHDSHEKFENSLCKPEKTPNAGCGLRAMSTFMAAVLLLKMILFV